ncbi:MAG: hypothetical protein DI535_22300 [Citrobacter freundii]|nr:MAG: hypothetical protein DI535_22300 [Citrobacter freundii]
MHEIPVESSKGLKGSGEFQKLKSPHKFQKVFNMQELSAEIFKISGTFFSSLEIEKIVHPR